MAGEWSWAKAFSLAFAVGIRPCTGAFLVLLFGYTLGLYWAGIAATFVMAIGTFITVATIASVAVYSRKLALKLSNGRQEWLGRIGFVLRMGGGIAIACFGVLLFLVIYLVPHGARQVAILGQQLAGRLRRN